MRNTNRLAAALTAALIATSGAAHADEGMWVFNNLPLKTLEERHGFKPTEEWINHLRSSAVRFNNGGSGSFVSANGLVMTNHHVASDVLQKLSTPDRDLYKIGYAANSFEEELKAPDLELNVLVGIENVTDKVNAAVKPGMTDAQANVARRGAMADIEKASLEKSGLRSDVVTLYQGGQYHLYTYKKYTDVRLVFAPEFDIAFFGGDEDNFEFPRYDLDVTFVRAYEDGKPAKIEHFLKWSKNGSKEGDLVFVAGHPGRTSRLFTMDHLEYLRDHGFPFLLETLRDREAFLLDYAKKGPEAARQSKDDLFSVQNSRKARVGGFGGLNDKDFMARKAEAEKTLRDKVNADPESKAKYAAAWDKIAAAEKAAIDLLPSYNFLERGIAFDSELFRTARTLVRLAEEKAKPNAERLREYTDAGLESLEFALFSAAPIYPEFEKARLAHSLADWQKRAGKDDSLVQQVLGGKSPEEVATALVEGTKLADVAVRKQFASAGGQALAQSADPMIALARLIDPAAREIRKKREDLVESVETANYALIAQARFDQLGDSVYPDATFTLRLAFGTVAGYEVDGKKVAPYTQFSGLFERAAAKGNTEPFKVPESWVKAKDSGKLPLDTPFNFVSTADIIGGNSGSPVVNRDGEVVGLIFDGNIQSLVLDFGYDDKIARAVSVDSRAIAEALRSVYSNTRLLEELTGSTK